MSKEQAVISKEIIDTVRKRLNNTESMDNYLKGLREKQEIPYIISYYLKRVVDLFVGHIVLGSEIKGIINDTNFKLLLINETIAWEDKLTIIAALMIRIENAFKEDDINYGFGIPGADGRGRYERDLWRSQQVAKELPKKEQDALKQIVESNLLEKSNSGIEFILGLIFLNKLQITEANVKLIIEKFHHPNNELWEGLYNYLKDTGRNKEKGLLCGELYCTILKDLTLEELSDVDKNIVTQWSRHMLSDDYTDEKIAFLKKADLKLIEDLIEKGFIEANQGNAEVLNKLLDVVRNNIELLKKLIENGFVEANQGNTDVLNELLDVVGNDIELLKKLIENGFVEITKPQPGTESEPAVEPEQCPFKRLLKQLEQLSDKGNKDAFECLTSLFPEPLSFQEITSSGLSEKTITAIFTQEKIARIVLKELHPNNIHLADIKEAAGLGVSYLKGLVDFSKAKNIKTNYSDMVWVIKEQLNNIDINSNGIAALKIVITEEPTGTTTLEVPDNKSNANKSILPLVGGATAGLAVGGFVAAVLSSASIAFMRANIILPIAIVGAIIGSLIASQQSQIER